ncbi:uncharacterized protein [Zea mays]|uniref:uncharacterized protein isoform X1 n=1 Tax=Zea mays TaxID=4577 RepID=UPI0009A97FC7|nr:uncharacterized protein LOC103636257 isoform X1 [Zea mays]|eukprot:XP_008656841.2 uncharacterized protein LOC103636257 isoform X1 [Zea mays]
MDPPASSAGAATTTAVSTGTGLPPLLDSLTGVGAAFAAAASTGAGSAPHAEAGRAAVAPHLAGVSASSLPGPQAAGAATQITGAALASSLPGLSAGFLPSHLAGVGTSPMLGSPALGAAPAASLPGLPAASLPGLPAWLGLTSTQATAALSAQQRIRRPPSGFSDPAWADTVVSSTATPPTSSALVAAIATIQAAVAASQEHERAASLALEQERAMGAALTAQMATAQRLLLGRSPTMLVAHDDLPITSEAPHVSGLDATTIVALHAQAVEVHNIRSLVSVVLDPTSSHYPRWRAQVLLTLRRFALADHVLYDLVTPLSPSWAQMDSVVLFWLNNTITVELQDIVRDQADTARQLWLALEDQFFRNREAWALHLDDQFHLFSQGDLSVGEYCRQMKGMADSLRDLGEPVADRTVVLNLLRGLSPRYSHLKALIKRTVPFPTFHVVWNKLLLEELIMETEAPAPAPPLYSSPPGGQAPSREQAPRSLSIGAPTRPPPAVPAAPRSASTANGGRRSRKGGRGGGGSTRGGPFGQGGGQAWPSFYNPWTRTISMWSGQASSASYPPVLALLTAPPYGVPPTPPYGVPPTTLAPFQLSPSWTTTSTPWSPLAGGWNSASLVAAFSTMAMTPPPSDWVVDSGASYHTTPTAGSDHQDPSRPL